MTEERIYKLEDRKIEITQSETANRLQKIKPKQNKKIACRA